jgi:hypothetical protein
MHTLVRKGYTGRGMTRNDVVDVATLHLLYQFRPPVDISTGKFRAMADIQNIVVTSTQTVTQPKPHTTYTIQGKPIPISHSARADV